MSVIKIPSKHIYSINNQKVLDNIVDKIEVAEYEVFMDNHYEEAVYNEEIKYNETDFFENSHGVDNANEVMAVDRVTSGAIGFFASFIYAENQIYLNKTIDIPMLQDKTHFLRKLLLGADENGNSDIKYTCSGKVISGTTNATSNTVVFVTNLSEVDWHYTTIKMATEYNELEKEQQDYTVENEYENEMVKDGVTVVSKIVTGKNNPFGDVKAEEILKDGKPYLRINLENILCGLRIVIGGGRGLATKNETQANMYSGTVSDSTYKEYVPEYVTITFYGNTIGIDLKEETVSINENGKNVISFTGNELMQSTNSPSIEDTYSKVIDEYKDGKELSTIRCGIEDYYSYKEEIVAIQIVSSNNLLNNPLVTITADAGLSIGDILVLGEEAGRYRGRQLEVVSIDWNKTYTCKPSVNIVGDFPIDTSATLSIRKVISKTRENNLPMTIQMGDIVIPYKFGANGKDKPMSLKKDGTEKEFEVVGKNIIYDGAIWQELTIQEKIEKDPIKLTLLSLLRQAIDTAYIEAKLKEGIVKNGDTIIYDGELADIYLSDDVGNYEIRCKIGGKFYNAIGTTIIANKR